MARKFKVSVTIESINDDKGFKAKRQFATAVSEPELADGIAQAHDFMRKFADEANKGIEYQPAPVQGNLSFNETTGELN